MGGLSPLWHLRSTWLCCGSPCRHLTTRNPGVRLPKAPEAAALGLGQVPGTFNMAGCAAGSLRPSLAPEGPGSCPPIPGLPGAFDQVALGQPMLHPWELGPIPSSCLSVPSRSVLTALGGWRPLPRFPAMGYCSSLGSPCSQQFPPPCLLYLDQQQGWMEAGAPGTGELWVWLCPCDAASSVLSVLHSAVSPETP